MIFERSVLGYLFRKLAGRQQAQENQDTGAYQGANSKELNASHGTDSKQTNTNQRTGAQGQVFKAQIIARNYTLAAALLFGTQGIVALLGAIDLIIPDLPSPIPFEYGRSIHLGLAVLWPLIGTMGMVYYFVTEDLDREIFSPRLAKWQFWLVLAASLSIYASLTFRLGRGREYLEGLPLSYAGISLALGLFSYNLMRTLIKHKQRITPAPMIMTAGSVLLLMFLIPNILSVTNPIADEATKFWVVHAWEEMAFELTTSGFLASYLKNTGLAAKKDIEKWLYLEAALTVAAGLFGTGHHYYWIGFPAYWLLVGFLFSFLQLIPVALLVLMVYKGLKKRPQLGNRQKLTLALILSSMLYHVTGASLLGFIITVPWINLYMHGTYITSGHAHLALFGSLGFSVLGGSYYILSRGTQPDRETYRRGIMAVLALNVGLLTMSTALIIAGFLQAYRARYLGMNFMEVNLQLNLYLSARAAGGAIFTSGDLLLTWQILKAWRKSKNAVS
ncbi:MAG: cbb3-type cytochrome c oxidase subunit I [Desulfitobacteriaceae bacterium]